MDWPRAARVDEHHPVGPRLRRAGRDAPAVSSTAPAAPAGTAAPAAGAAPRSRACPTCRRQRQPRPLAPPRPRPAPATPVTAAAGAAANAPTVRIVTDVIDMDLSLQGGDLLRADLMQYPKDKKPGSPPVRLLSTDDATFSIVRSGLRVADGRPEPTHLATYTTPATEYRLAPGAQELRVPLTWTDGQGVTVMKTYVFKPGQYGFDVVYDVQNASGTRLAGRLVPAVRAPCVRAGTLDVRRRELRVPWPRHLRRQEVPEARRRGQGRLGVPAGNQRRLDGRDAASLRHGRGSAEGRDVRFLAAPRRRAFTRQLPRAAQERAGRCQRDVQREGVHRSQAAGRAEGRPARSSS